MDYVVKAGFVTVETAVGKGRAYIDIPHGEHLPADVPAEQVDALLSRGEIEADGRRPGKETKPSHTPPSKGPDAGADGDPEQVPDGTVAVVMEWVDGDLDRAQRALEAERGKGEQARGTLVKALEAVTGKTA